MVLLLLLVLRGKTATQHPRLVELILGSRCLPQLSLATIGGTPHALLWPNLHTMLKQVLLYGIRSLLRRATTQGVASTSLLVPS